VVGTAPGTALSSAGTGVVAAVTVAVSIPSGIVLELLTKNAFDISTTTHIKNIPSTTIAAAPLGFILATIGVFLLRTFLLIYLTPDIKRYFSAHYAHTHIIIFLYGFFVNR
jgi:hypothetical protein